MFIYFIILLINALIERELRLAMKRNNIQSLPLYPEKRKCKYPATERIISLYANQSKHVLMDKDKMVKVFNDPLSEIQELVLSLSEVFYPLLSESRRSRDRATKWRRVAV